MNMVSWCLKCYGPLPLQALRDLTPHHAAPEQLVEEVGHPLTAQDQSL